MFKIQTFNYLSIMFQSLILFFKKNDKRYTVNLNWGFLLTFVFFWTYSYYGAVTKFESLNEKFGVSFLLVTIYIVLLVLSFNWRSYLSDTIRFSKADIKYFFFFLFFFTVITFNNLLNFLNGDQFYHSQFSIYHSIFILKLINQKTQSFNLVQGSHLLHIINIIILLSITCFTYIILKIKSKNIKIVLLVVAFIFFRLLISYFGGSSDVHPSFRLFPLWISSSFFGINSFAFRFPQLIASTIIVFISFKTASKYLTENSAVLFSISIGTIPILLHTGILVEQSIWATVVITYILYVLYNKINQDGYEINYIRMASIISIGVLMRQSIAVCVILMFILIIIDFRRNKINREGLLIISFVLILSLPFLLSNILIKNPALSSISNEMFKGGILHSIFSGISFYSIINNFLYLTIFLPFAFFISKRSSLYFYLYLFLGILLYCEFYSIRPILWGVGRYQTEFILPFIIIGLLFVSVKFAFINTQFFTCLIILNIFVFYNFNKLNKSHQVLKYTYFNTIKRPFTYFIQSEWNYPYDLALNTVKESGFSYNFFIYGTTYGNMPEVLAGYNVGELIRYNKLNKYNTLPLESIVNNLEKNKGIELILFSDLEDSVVFNKLKKNGWLEWNKFTDKSSANSIRSLTRMSH